MDGASETLRVVRFDDGEQFYCDALERRTPYVVQITSGPNAGDDFVGLYDLDGEQLQIGNRSWEIATDVPADVLDTIESGWVHGTTTVTRERVG